MVAVSTGIGGQMDGVAPRHKSLHAVGFIPEAYIQVGTHPSTAKLFAEQQQRCRTNAAAHHRDGFILPGQTFGIESVAAGAGDRQGLAGLQGCQFLGSLPFT